MAERIEVEQARTWLGDVEPDELDIWTAAHERAADDTESAMLDDRLVAHWYAQTSDEVDEVTAAEVRERFEAARSAALALTADELRARKTTWAQYSQAKAHWRVSDTSSAFVDWEDWVDANVADEHWEQFRDDVIARWRERDDTAESPQMQRRLAEEQARAWLGVVDSDAARAFDAARWRAATSAESTADMDRLVELWWVDGDSVDTDSERLVEFRDDTEATQQQRTERVERAEDWLRDTDSRDFYAWSQSRGFADTVKDEAGDERRLVQEWLAETGGQVTEEQLRGRQLRAEAAEKAQAARERSAQLRADTAALEQAEQGLRQRMTQRVRGWVSTERAAVQSTRERDTGLEL